MRIARRTIVALAVVAGLVVPAAAGADSIWTPLSSGTTDTISSIVYQSPTRFWYATTDGKIEYFNGSGFVAGTGITGDENFTDLAFQPTSVPGGPGTSGLYGYAVASDGDVWQTSDGGVSWTEQTTPFTRSNCLSTTAPSQPESQLNAVVWASSDTVYLAGDNSTLLKSTSAATTSPTFSEINKNGSGTCVDQGNSDSENLTDATFLPASPSDGFMIGQDFGTLFQTSNGFATGVKRSRTVNQFNGNPRIAQSSEHPSDLWAVDHAAGGAGCGRLCLQHTNDGGSSSANVTFPNDSSPSVGLYGISSEAGTEVTAGSGGEIFTSVDGSNFYLQPAGGDLATEDWRAEGAFDATHAAVGGVGGALAVTAAANTIPRGAPRTGSTPPGTSPVGAKKPVSRPPSGSRPTTLRIGGAKIIVYRIVTVTHRKGRFVPVVLSSSHPRKFVVTILTRNGKRRVAVGRLTLKHRGHKTIHIGIRSKFKPGKYEVVVRVLTLKGHQLARRTVAFKLV